MSCRAALAAVGLLLISCSHPASNRVVERVAILRFENLSGDPSLNWMGRAFAEIVSRDLATGPGVYAIPPSRLQNLDAALGKRPAGTPGVSSERTAALGLGADRLGYGEYWQSQGKLQARLTIEELPGGKMRVIAVAGSDLFDAGDAVAGKISTQASRYGSRNEAAIEDYALGVEAGDTGTAAQQFSAAIAADADFEPPYEALAELKSRQRDTAGAAAVLNQALAHRDRMPELERAQLAFDSAGLQADAAARQQALDAWTRLTPNDPVMWRSAAETAMSRHEYKRSVEAYQKALGLQPDDAAFLNQLGYAAAYAGDLSAAQRVLQHYQGLRPADPNPLDSLGDVNLLADRPRQAENYYLQAAKKAPDFLGGGDFRKAAMARLMSGDIEGATKLEEQYLGYRMAVHDPLVDYYRAEWAWIAGKRKEAYQGLEAFAHANAGGPAAAEAYGELAVWSVALGHRRAAQDAAEKSGAGQIRAIARFLAQSSASPDEWQARADRLFPEPAQKPLKQSALVYALLSDRHFAAASPILKAMYEAGTPGAEEVPFLLGWCDLETGRVKEAAGLLHLNPVPPSSGVHPFQVFYFPRLFYLRGRIAMLAGQPDAAREQFRLFLQLSGDAPLVWGEEAQAH